MFAVPVVLRPEEVFPAFYAANRRLNPIGKGRMVLLWVVLVGCILEAAAAVLPAEKQNRLADARAIWALGNLLDLMRELELLPDEGEE